MVSNKRLQAEQSASIYLQMRGYGVNELNFKRSKYAIDIVAQKRGEIYFVVLTVLGQSSQTYDLMTPSQIAQMRLAAASWIEEMEWMGNIHYSIIEVDSDSNAVMTFIEDLF